MKQVSNGGYKFIWLLQSLQLTCCSSV